MYKHQQILETGYSIWWFLDAPNYASPVSFTLNLEIFGSYNSKDKDLPSLAHMQDNEYRSVRRSTPCIVSIYDLKMIY